MKQCSAIEARLRAAVRIANLFESLRVLGRTMKVHRARSMPLRKLSGGLLSLPRQAKRAIAILVDVALCLLSTAAAFALRLDGWSLPTALQLLAYAAAVVFAIPMFISFGLYRAIFRFAGRGAMVNVLKACGLYSLAYCLTFTFYSIAEIPRTIGLIQPMLLLLSVGTSRFLAHFLLGSGYQALLQRRASRRVLIYGAGAAGRQLAAALASSNEMNLVGYVDDSPALHGHVLNGKRIYPGSKLARLIQRLEIDDLLLAIPSAPRKRRAEVIESLKSVRVSIRTVPGLMDIAHGRIKMQDLRELEIEDLLGREAVPPNQLLLAKNTFEKVVMVTGAGGSIGSELCRKILSLRPKTLLLFDNAEFNLYAVGQNLEQLNIDDDGNLYANVVKILGSVRDQARLRRTFEIWKPDTVYHAAAYKHVPIVEDNPSEGVLNNVEGTWLVANEAIRSGVRDFVLVSTDKAVRPTNIMGATKRAAELVLQALAAENSSARFSMVRFGNVLGSSGSVVPLFRQQIKAGGPVTLTHPDITRYFMTIPEAALLVIQAGAMAKGGEVFVLDMGEPVKVLELAKRMIQLSGLRIQDEDCPDGDIVIECVGLRPGEKLYEELLIGDNARPTTHPRIMMAKERYLARVDLEPMLEALFSHARDGNTKAVIRELNRLVPEFTTSPGQRKIELQIDRQQLDRNVYGFEPPKVDLA